MYEQSEAALGAALKSLTTEQFKGFGVALFDGGISTLGIRTKTSRGSL
jgi:hypothetical protein